MRIVPKDIRFDKVVDHNPCVFGATSGGLEQFASNTLQRFNGKNRHDESSINHGAVTGRGGAVQNGIVISGPRVAPAAGSSVSCEQRRHAFEDSR